MPESVAVISLSRQLQLQQAASSTLHTAGINLAAPQDLGVLGGQRRRRQGAAMQQVLTNLLLTNPQALSVCTHTQEAATHSSL